ncbi:hypothetical protein HPB48_018872 [Haemaphysalis longicornis]|uniref:Uncharacterized protein n=1 Tax=Haemaphysalis longicornis TaxID=44386 RepID=A0A9J6GV92_HAELO|nr:hypothetical protein HPB48_018872 [Haemaphysalis longicornis]
MHPQLQDLAEGKSFATLAELAKAADELTERAWRRYQYRPPPPPGSQVARDLAFCPTVATTAGSREPLLDVSIESTTFQALLDPGSSVSLLGSAATAAAQAAGSKTKMELHTLRLASGWFQASSSLKSKIYWGSQQPTTALYLRS